VDVGKGIVVAAAETDEEFSGQLQSIPEHYRTTLHITHT
jgi:hypothetical protein